MSKSNYFKAEWVFGLSSFLNPNISNTTNNNNKGYSKMDFQPHIQIQTNFKRSNESITKLLGMNYFKYIDLDPDTTIKQVQTTIREHYRACNGTLKMWGDITEYHLMHSEESATVFNVAGDVIGQESFEIVDAELV
jgi:hypothetical protein